HGAVSTILTHCEIGQAHLRQRYAQFTQGRYNGVRAGHLPEGVVAKIKLTTFEPRPWNVVVTKPVGKTISLERATLIYAVLTVHLGDELILNVRPMIAKLFEGLDIYWNAVSFHARAGRHVTAAQQSARQVDVG